MNRCGCLRITVLLLAGAMPSCVALEHPPIDPSQAKTDERLFGVWKALPDEMDGGYCYLFVGRPQAKAPSGMMEAITISNDRRETIKRDATAFFQVPLGQANYAVMVEEDMEEGQQRKKPRRSPQYSLLKYAVEGDRLTVWAMDGNAVEDAVKRGKLKGTVTKGGIIEWKSVVITETGDNLLRFLKEHQDSLFVRKPMFVFTKCK
jgi:hypothetical protein